MPSLTDHLLSLDVEALQQATTHPFLKAAATQSLPLPRLQAWLAQDRLYQLAYLTFIGSMLSSIPVPGSSARESSLEWRAADLFIDSLANLRTEIRMFESTAQNEGWLEAICGVAPELPTRAYQDLFAGATAQGRPLVVGLTVLWATEECYLRAWRYARSQVDAGVAKGEGDVMQREFIPNWTSEEFEAFVRRIGGLLDEFGSRCEEGGWEWRECETAFRQVLWAEKAFWPNVDS